MEEAVFMPIWHSAFTQHLQHTRCSTRAHPDKGESVFTSKELTVQGCGQPTSRQTLVWKFHSDSIRSNKARP